MKTFRGLTKAQSIVFEQIAIGNDHSHSFGKKTLKTLEDKGLIFSVLAKLDDGGYPPVQIRKYRVPIPIHIEWCKYCQEVKNGL